MTPIREAISDYEQVRPIPGWRKKIEAILRQNRSLWKALGLHKPRVAFLKSTDWIAVYIAGTTNYPVIGIDLNKHLELAKECEINPVTGIETSIIHEAGHAYLESCGIDTGDHPEQDVEEFAREYSDGASPETAKAILDAVVRGLGCC